MALASASPRRKTRTSSQEGPALPERLRQVPLLAQLGEAELRELSGSLRPRRFRAGQTILLQDCAGNELYLVLEGQVRITNHSACGREVTLAVLKPGSFFGDMALLDGQPRSASAYADEPCLLQVLDRGQFHRFLEQHPSCAVRLLGYLSQRLREANERIQSLSVLTVRQRLAGLLADLAIKEGEETPEGLLLPASNSHRELAGWLGASRETVSRMVSDLRGEGLLDARGRRILVPNVEALKEVVSG